MQRGMVKFSFITKLVTSIQAIYMKTAVENDIDGLVVDCSISSANAQEILHLALNHRNIIWYLSELCEGHSFCEIIIASVGLVLQCT